MSATVWTVEMADRSFDDVERLLAGYGISMIIDVRPDRRAPVIAGVETATLEDLADEAGFGYRWMGHAGGPGSEATVAAITAIASVSDAAVLCDGPGNGRCTAFAAFVPGLQHRGVRILHLLGDGSAVPHEPRLPLER
jgi:protein tyrosine phosphatase (PTP) superfamily phosphohydrolase (DUF442 family)